MLTVGPSGTVWQPDAPAVALARAGFDTHHLMRLPGFFDAGVLAAFDARLPGASYRDRREGGRLIERQLADDRLLALALVLLNDPVLLRAIDVLTGCGEIGSFAGRVYARSGAEQYFPWHSDCVDERLIAISVNLGARPFEGGALQVRRAGTDAVLAEVTHQRRGDAALVRIDPGLEHRVTPVTSDVPRLVLAGWFRRRPSFRDLLGW